jgi:hypothetical protein
VVGCNFEPNFGFTLKTIYFVVSETLEREASIKWRGEIHNSSKWYHPVHKLSLYQLASFRSRTHQLNYQLINYVLIMYHFTCSCSTCSRAQLLNLNTFHHQALFSSDNFNKAYELFLPPVNVLQRSYASRVYLKL